MSSLNPSSLGPPTASAPSILVTAPLLKLPKPKIGNIIQISKDEFSAWTNGMPMADWSGLDPTAPTYFKSPNLLHPITKGSQEGYNFQSTGLVLKFKAGNDVTLFSEKCLRHFVDTGMDSIAYIWIRKNLVSRKICYFFSYLLIFFS